MDTGDPETPAGAPPEGAGEPADRPPEGAPGAPAPTGAPPGWNPAPPGPPQWGAPQPPAWGQGGPPPAGAPPGWNPAPPGPPQWGAPQPAWGQGGPPPVGPTPPPGPPGWNPVPPGQPVWTPAYGSAIPPPPGAPPGWNPAPPGAPPGYPPHAMAGAYAQPYGPAGALRPRSVMELLDGAFSLYRRNFLLLVAIAALVQVPYALLQVAVFRLVDIGGHLNSIEALQRSIANGGGTLTPDQSTQVLNDVGAVLAFAIGSVVLQFLIVFPLSVAATTSAVSARYLDRPATVWGSYSAALRMWRPLIAMVLWLVLVVVGAFAATIAVGLATNLGVVLGLGTFGVLVFAVIVLVRTSVAPQAIVIERRSGWTGIRRSWELTQASFWRITGLRVLLLLIGVVVGYAITIPAAALAHSTDLGTQQLIGQVASAFSSVFVAPITLVALTLLYYDLRIRREGFDIEMLADSL